jgi:hypothetical protein
VDDAYARGRLTPQTQYLTGIARIRRHAVAKGESLREGIRVFDTRLRRERLIFRAQHLGSMLKNWFKDTKTGVSEFFSY